MVARLAWLNLKARPSQAVFLLLVMCLSTTTVSLGLAVSETGREPWLRLHNSINGYHVQAFAAYHTGEELNGERLPMPDPANVARADNQLAELAGEPEVTAVSGPWPLLVAFSRVGGLGMQLDVEVRDPNPATVSHPLIVSGKWLDSSDDTIVLEDGLASLLKVAPGDKVTVADQRLRVLGSAMTTSVPRYPMQFPATVWTNQATAAKLRAAGAIPLGATIELQLARAQDAAAFVAAHGSAYGRPSLMQTWERARNRSAGSVSIFAVALTLTALLLAGLTVATAAVLVTGRMAAQSRQIGALKAVGVTPRQALCVVLVEYLAVAMVAAGIGIVAGTLLSPLLGRGLPVLYSAPVAPPITWPRALAALAVAMAVVVAGSVPAALRGVRQSTVRALASGVRPPRRASWAARLAATAGAPLPAVLGLRSALRRPVRTIANATGLAMGVAMVILGLGISKLARDYLASPPRDGEEALARTVLAVQIDQVLTVVFIGAGLLIGLAAIQATIAAIFAARDSARSHAILRALGATPRQTVTSFVVAQLGASLLGCAAGIPLGVLLFDTVVASNLKDRTTTITLPASIYVTVAVAAPLLYLLVAIIPAAQLARRRVAPVLAISE